MDRDAVARVCRGWGRPAWVVGFLVLMLMQGPVFGQAQADAVSGATPTGSVLVEVEGVPIQKGAVVIDGQLIEGPYRVGQAGGRLTINGRPVLVAYSPFDRREAFEDWRGYERRSEDRPDNASPRPTEGPAPAPGASPYEGYRGYRGAWSSAEWVERRLNEEYLLVFSTDLGVAPIAGMMIPKYLEVMSLDVPVVEKIDRLNQLVDRPMYSAVWQAIIEDYRPDAELSAIGAEMAAQLELRRQAQSDKQVAGRLHLMMPLVAFAAVLVAIGVLLRTHRAGLYDPPEQRLWRHVDPSGKRSRLVFQLLAVLVLLNALDLLFTLLAQRTGQFIELSPVGDRMITNPVVLGFYKTTLVALGAGILLFLRHRRAAEVTAWWLCALYILVLVRWAAVNTILVA